MTQVVDPRVVVDTTPALLHSARADGYIDYFNRRWLDYVGASLDALAGWAWAEFIHPEDRGELVGRWRRALESGEPAVSEARVRGANGEYRWMLHRTLPLRDRDGRIVRWFGTSIDIEELKRTQHELQELKDRLYRENIALKDEVAQASMFEEIVGSSAPLRRTLSLVSKVAGTDSTVLILGETGTGKELLARAIHKRSSRASRPFVSVSCGAIAPSLIVSELFGHEKGAFTGALQRQLGRFELAETGTIFLDEVGELPPEAQVALLRVLQEGTFERIGGGKPIATDVRVVAATNRDLERAIAEGSFRSDLYYRLSVFPIHVPPLRDRAADIPVLVDYLIGRYAARVGKKITSVSKRTMDVLGGYAWPGNVRELQNVIQRAVILCDGDTLVVDESWLKRPLAEAASVRRGLGRPDVRDEKRMIEDALAGACGRVAGPDGAAAKLGIPRSTLESRIRALHIDKNRYRTA